MAGSASENDQLIRDFLAAWERRDTEFIVERLADEAVYHAMPLAPIAGRHALTEWVRGFEQVPPGRLLVHHQVAEGNVVMNERTDRITIRGTEVALQICAVFEIEAGRVTAWREYFDMAGLQAALGP